MTPPDPPHKGKNFSLHFWTNWTILHTMPCSSPIDIVNCKNCFNIVRYIIIWYYIFHHQQSTKVFRRHFFISLFWGWWQSQNSNWVVTEIVLRERESGDCRPSPRSENWSPGWRSWMKGKHYFQPTDHLLPAQPLPLEIRCSYFLYSILLWQTRNGIMEETFTLILEQN